MPRKRNSDHIAILQTVSLFEALPLNELKTLAESARLVRYPKESVLFKVGDPGETMYILCSGAIRFYNRDPMGKEIELEEIRTGFFGEVAVLAGGIRSATAQVTEDLTALELTRTDFEKFLKKHPNAALILMGDMARRLRRAGDQLRLMIPLNINSAWEKTETPLDRSIHSLAEHCASLPFLLGNALFFAGWIALNLLLGRRSFDHPPFPWLSLIVTLEALTISTIVLYSQNAQTSKERVRNEVEFSANLDSALIIAEMKETIDELSLRLKEPD